MPIKSTLVGDATGPGVHLADTVEFQGEPWLVVAGWLPAEQEGMIRPVRIVRPIGAVFQPGGGWSDYILQLPIPKAVLEGTEPISPDQYEVVEWPDITFEDGAAHH